jgi:hypothetical protein
MKNKKNGKLKERTKIRVMKVKKKKTKEILLDEHFFRLVPCVFCGEKDEVCKMINFESNKPYLCDDVCEKLLYKNRKERFEKKNKEITKFSK